MQRFDYDFSLFNLHYGTIDAPYNNLIIIKSRYEVFKVKLSII